MNLQNIVSRYLKICMGNEQQDAHEFLTKLMEKLHMEINRVPSKLNLLNNYTNLTKSFHLREILRINYLPLKPTSYQFLKEYVLIGNGTHQGTYLPFKIFLKAYYYRS